MVVTPVISDLKHEAIYEERATRLFEIMIEINEMIANNYIELSVNEDQTAKTFIKGQISILNALLTIIDKRIDLVKANDHENERREMIANRQFRIAAEAVLQRETFEKIKELSLLNYQKLKGMKGELRLNKIE